MGVTEDVKEHLFIKDHHISCLPKKVEKLWVLKSYIREISRLVYCKTKEESKYPDVIVHGILVSQSFKNFVRHHLSLKPKNGYFETS
jgi:hypothetical protein